MSSLYDCEKDLEEISALELVDETEHPDDLVHIMTSSVFHDGGKSAAAEKILKNFSTRLDHVLCVAQYANEPYRSRAEKILHNHRW